VTGHAPKNKPRALAGTRDAADCKAQQQCNPYSRPKARNLAGRQPPAAGEWVVVRASDIPPRARAPELVAHVAELAVAGRRCDAPPKYLSGNYVRQVGQRLHAIKWQGRQWSVTSFGIEKRDGCYAIPFDRLEALNWISHLAGKIWIDLPDFAEALRIARRIKRRGNL
jgi:hypothetical protein